MATKLWEGATSREFNIGLQAGTSPDKLEVTLDAATIADVARLGARIGVTVYAYDSKHAVRVRRRGPRR
jgi:hypothetical protein